MKFILTSGWDDGVADLTARLAEELRAGKKVLWLVSGGSNVWAEVDIMDELKADLTSNLTVLPADERYGPVGHADSNLQQLYEAGFEPEAATVVPVLHNNLDFNDTAYYYDKIARKLFKEADIIIGQLGIGDDGHIAGILPGSPAATAKDKWAAGYDGPDYRRLSLTFPALRNINAAYVFAFGKMKRKALEAVMTKKLPLSRDPAQLFKLLPEAYLYNDQVGDT